MQLELATHPPSHRISWKSEACQMETPSDYIMQLELATHPPHQLEIRSMLYGDSKCLYYGAGTGHPPTHQPTASVEIRSMQDGDTKWLYHAAGTGHPPTASVGNQKHARWTPSSGYNVKLHSKLAYATQL